MLRNLAIFAVLLLVAQAAVYKLKLEKHEGKSANLMKEGKPHEIRAFREAARKEYKLRLSHKIHSSRNNRGNRLAASQPLYDYADQLYIVNVSIGTPPQPFRFLIDTYSGDTWVADSTCSDDICECGDGNPACQSTRRFDSSASSTYVVDGRQYADNNTGGTGFLGQDTISLADGLQVPKVIFGQMDYPFSYIISYAFDGFLGLTYKSVDGVKSVIQEAVDQGLLDQPIFTIYYGTDGLGSNEKVGGQITYGGVDTTNCASAINYVPVLSQLYWEFSVDKVEINGKGHSDTSWIGIAEATTAIIGLPTQPLNDIVDATGATFNSDFGIYQVDCNVQFQWIITLNKNRFVVDQTKAVLSVGDGVTCFLGFEDLEYPGFDILLGSPFMRDFCAVYDITGKLGFAQVKAN